MVLGRKFIIWFVSFIVVLAAFLLYRSASNSGVIEITRLERGVGQMDANQFISDSNAGQVGQAKVEYLERARFETVDVKTRKLKRVVGFEKVLHKTGNEWLLDKPYMNVFQEKLRYDITADTGTVEIENVEGANPVAKSAVLKGNVVIHILPKAVAGQSDSFVYLNQVTFDSDRAMFYSDDDVNFISADAHLMGKGLQIVYNNITNRLDYLKIKQVDFLNVRSVAQTGQAKEKRPQDTAAKTSSAEPAGAEAGKNKESYECLFRDNVVLEYKNEVVLASEVAITELLMSSSEETGQPQTPTSSAEPNTSGNIAEQQPNIKAPAIEEKGTVIATVKCDGPMIIRPTSAAESEDYKPAPFRKFMKLPDKTLQWLGKRNVLLAQRVSYDYTAQIAKAHGPVEIVFYPEMTTYAKQKDRPFMIDARNGAEFISESNRAIFYGNVKGIFNKRTDYYDEENTFYGDKLVVDLAKGRNSPQAVGSANVSHITVTGPGVRLESIKTLGETKLSHVRLKSARIDYDRITEDIIATGKGTIEYGNTATGNFKDLSSKSALGKPCYALVEGFDKLVWDTNALQVKAFSEKSKGVHIGYLPIEKDASGREVRGRTITVDTRQIDIDYFEPTQGKTQLKQLYATGGIVYYEQPRYEFVGKDLYYDAQKEHMTVNGDKDMPCMLNGAFADAIEYDLKTGSASAVLSSGIGIMPVKE
jgi:lipopolysaccharide export system protein LptA